MSSQLSQQQILQQLHDESNQALQVRGVGGTLVTEKFDYIAAAYPTATQEVYTYKMGGAGGTVVATLTINYVDSSKDQLVSIIKA